MINKILEFLECKRLKKKDIVFCGMSVLILIATLFIPTGFEQMKQKGGIGVKCKVIEADNTDVKFFGLIKQGSQALKLEILDTKYKGQIVTCCNTLIGKMELDTFYKVNDITFTVIETVDNRIINATTVGYYRIDITIILYFLLHFY